MTDNKPVMPRNTIFVGKDRPITEYALPIMTMINNGEKRIIVKSRGTCNSNNLSLNQYLLNKVFKGRLKVVGIDIGTEVLENKDGRRVNVTTLSIKYDSIG